MREYKLLLGATKDNSLVFAEIDLGVPTTEQGRHDFSVSFDEVYPCIASNEYLKTVAENLLDGAGSDYCEKLMDEYECGYDELAEEYVSHNLRAYGVEGVLDISLFSDSFRVEGIEDDIYFESSACGQVDTRGYLLPIDSDFTDWLFDMWDKHHLKVLTDVSREIARLRLEQYDWSVDKNDWIQKWLETYYENHPDLTEN